MPSSRGPTSSWTGRTRSPTGWRPWRMSSELAPLPQSPWTRVRTVLNWLNLSTPLGLAIARIGGASIVHRGRGTYLATGYRFGFPVASAFTISSVITSRHDLAYFVDRPVLLQHEDRHCTQYAFV